MAGYILTYTKTKFYPLEPIKEDIKIEDISHSLSLLTRANGHFEHFYSVAQHCINCYKEAKARGYSERVQLGCLLHDASESYISDITRPVKQNLSEYFIIEEKLQETIHDWFGIGDLSQEERQQIKDVDDALLYYEFKSLMNVDVFDEAPHIATQHDFSLREFAGVEKEFVSIFSRLTGSNKGYCCVGIDGCKGKWVAVCISEDGFEVEKFNNIRDICERYSQADRILIDIPIGLAESKEDLRPDALVKKELGRKGSSIFQVPCRQAVYQETKEAAREKNIAVLGKSLSEQTLAITKAIRQADEFLTNHPQWKNRLLESHPEFCFAKLNNNTPIFENKMTEEGKQRRLAVLQKHYPEAENVINKYLADVPYRKKTDDVIDALCLAVIGRLTIEGSLKSVPEQPMKDARGLYMQIVYGC